MPKRNTYGRSENTKRKARAVRELNNIDLIYTMGDKPYYAHSLKAYFKSGFNIAKATMAKLTHKMFANRKEALREYAILIDARWHENLKKAFGDAVPTFYDFKELWDTQQGDGTLFNKLQDLAALKEAKVKESVWRERTSKIKHKYSLVEGSSIDEAKLARINAELAPEGIQIVSFNSKAGRVTWGGAAYNAHKTNESIISKMTSKYIELIEKKAKTDKRYQTIKNTEIAAKKTRAAKQLVNQGKKGKLTAQQIAKIEAEGMTSLAATSVGFLLEYESIGDYIFKVAEDDIRTLMVENVAKAVYSDSKSTADSKITIGSIEVDAESVDFYFSDKASGSVDFRADKSWYNNQVDEQFHAEFESSQINFAELKVKGYDNLTEFQHVQKLYNYVAANQAAFYRSKGYPTKSDIDAFYELIILYGAWLRLSKAIVGNMPPNALTPDAPIGIRTLRTIYNIADLLRYFIKMESPEMLHFCLRQADLDKSIRTPKITLTTAQKIQLLDKKRDAIEELVDKAAKDNKNFITYEAIMNYSQLQELFRNLFSSGFSGIKTSYVVKLKNIEKRI